MIQCKNHARGECGAELCHAGRRPRCARYAAARRYAAYGWEVTVRFGLPLCCEQTYHWRGCSEAAARRKGMLKSRAEQIVAIEPVTEEQWIRAYGDPDLQESLR